MRIFVYLLVFLTASFSGFCQVLPDSLNLRFSRLSQEIESMNPEIPERIPYYFIRLPELRSGMDSLESLLQNRAGQLILPEPRKYNTFKELQSYFEHFERMINDKMKVIELVFYEGALESLSEGDSLVAEQRLRQSIQYNPSYSPSLYALVRLLIQRHQVEEAETILHHALVKVDTIHNSYYASLWKRASQEVFSAYLRKADQFMRQDDYLSAIQLTHKAENLTNRLNIRNNADSVQAYYSFAHDGMFLGYLRIAQRAIDQKKWDLARLYLQKTRDYLDSNQRYVRSGPQLEQAHERLEQQHLLNIREQQEKPKRAPKNTYAKKRRKSPKTRSAVTRPLRISKTETLVSKTDTLVPVMDTLRRDSILNIIHAAYFLTWKNKLDTAQIILQSSLESAKKYHFDTDREFLNAQQELQHRIEERKCFTVQTTYDLQTSRAALHFKRQNYLEAADALSKAREAIQTGTTCISSDSILQGMEKEYAPIIQFARYKDTRTSYLIRGAIDSAYALSVRIEQWAENQKDPRLEAGSLSPSAFLIAQYDKKLTLAFLEAATRKQNAQDCLKFLEIYRQQGGAAPEAQDQIEQSARLVAETDHKTGSVSDAKKAWAQLHLDADWYKLFKKAYLKRFNQLNKGQHP